MGSMTCLVALFLVVLAAAPAYATDYTVGDSSGWTSGSDYTTWASGKKFNVGDSLQFSYSMLHSVSEVSKSDYDSCSATNSVQTYTDGSTTIKLDAPGTRYFICGTSGHCSAGMKLAVDVGSGSGSSSGSGSGSAPAPSNSDSPSAGSGGDDTPSSGTDNGSGATSSNPPASTTPTATNTPATRSTTSPSSKTTPATSTNAAAGSGFRAAGGLMVGVSGLVGLALMG